MASGLCLRFALDTYEQELERFGGPAGMIAAEGVFAADSRAAALLLRHVKRWSGDRTTLAILSIDDLLFGLGLDERARLRWYKTQTTTGGPDVGAEYRQRKTILRSTLGQPRRMAEQPGGAEIASTLAMRASVLAPIGRHLRTLAESGELSQPLDDLYRSFIHLHLNRLGGLDAAAEQRILGLLLRARDSIEKAPLAAPRVDGVSAPADPPGPGIDGEPGE